MRIAMCVLSLMLLMPLTARGQDNSQAPQPADSKPAAKPVENQGPRPLPLPGTLNNIHIELTISDQTGSAPPDKKTVAMIVSNRAWGKIRASAEAFQKSAASKIVPVGLNIDARPDVYDNLIRLELTVIYSPMMLASTNDTAQTRPTELNQSLTVTLQNGKPLVVSQAADPVSDRKISVEVKATLLK